MIANGVAVTGGVEASKGTREVPKLHDTTEISLVDGKVSEANGAITNRLRSSSIARIKAVSPEPEPEEPGMKMEIEEESNQRELGLLVNKEVLGRIKSVEAAGQGSMKFLERHHFYLMLKNFPLYRVMQEASKVLTTHDWTIAREDMKCFKILQMIQSLKERNLWSARQPVKFKPPPRKKSHWDYLLDEAVSLLHPEVNNLYGLTP